MAASRAGFLWLAIFLIAAVSRAGETTRELAAELISVMKVVEQGEQQVEKLILRHCQEKKCDTDMRQCLLKKDSEDFRIFMVFAAEKALTPDELAEAITYFKTEIGLKHLDVLRAEQRLGGNDTLFNQTPEVRAGMLAFLDTRAGYLLITRSVLRDTFRDQVQGQAYEAFWRCEPKQ